MRSTPGGLRAHSGGRADPEAENAQHAPMNAKVSVSRRPWLRAAAFFAGALMLALGQADAWLPKLIAPLIERKSADFGLPVRIRTLRTDIWHGHLELLDLDLPEGARIHRVAVDLDWARLDRPRIGGIRIEALRLPARALSRIRTIVEGSSGTVPSAAGIPVGRIEISSSVIEVETGAGGLALQLPWLHAEAGSGGFRVQARADLKMSRGEASGIQLSGTLSPDVSEWQGQIRADRVGLRLPHAQGSARLDWRGRLDLHPDGAAGAEGTLTLSGAEAELASGRIDVDRFAVHLKAAFRPGAEASIELARFAPETPISVAVNWPEVPFAHLGIEAFELGALKFPSREPAPLRIAIALGARPRIGGIEFEGRFVPASPIELAGRVKLAQEAVPLSALAERWLGIRPTSGRAIVEGSVFLRGSRIRANTHLQLKRLQIARANPAALERLSEHLGLSPDLALDLLRDANGNIELDVPIEADLAQGGAGVAADLSAVYGKALISALGKAALGYLKNAFQPYGMAVDALLWIGEQSRRFRLSPVFFAPGTAEPDSEGLKSLEKLAGFLERHREPSVAICAVTTVSEAPPGNAEKLASERVQRVIEALAQRGVDRNRLTLCRNRREDAKDARPRVEVLL